MPRISRIIAIGFPHHITQKGNYSQGVFKKNFDFKNYLHLTNIYKRKYGVSILSYCLMPNHIHIIAIPGKNDSFAKTFNTVHMCYSQYFNKSNNLKGHLWQDRFYSCPLDEKHLYHAVRYVENNPVRAGLVARAEEWDWSSANAHMNQKKSVLELKDISNYLNIDDWESYLKQAEDQVRLENIRSFTRTGRPLGGKTFTNELEKTLNRSLGKPKMGRPQVAKK